MPRPARRRRRRNRLRFPIFLDLRGRQVLIFGGGAVALRRAEAVLPYGASVTVVAKEPLPAFGSLPLTVERRAYRPGEIGGAALVLAATDDRAVNAAIAAEAREKGILSNNASDREDCDFFFPALIRTKRLSIGLCGTGEDHQEVREAAEKIREVAF